MSSKNRDITHITRPPWALQNGLVLFSVVYFLVAGFVLYLSWRWALGKGWPSYPLGRSILSWGQWIYKSWSISPGQLLQGQGWLWPGRLTLALVALCPWPLAAWAGWWAAKPLPWEIPVAGRRLSHSPREAAQEMRQECKWSEEGIMIHPDIPISLDRESKHSFISGGTGTGKTVILHPIICQAIQREGDRAIIYCNKGDNTKVLPPAPGCANDEITLFAPWDARCVAWDIAADIFNRSQARTIAARFVPETEKDPMWGLAAQSILTAVFIKYQTKTPYKWDLKDVLTDVFSTYDQIREIVLTYHPEGIHVVEDAIKTKTTQSFLINLSSFLSQVVDLAEAWHGRQKFSFKRWLLDPESNEARSKKAKYIILQGSEEYEKLSKAYLEAVIETITTIVASPKMEESEDRRLWFFLDEFPQLGKVQRLAKMLEIGRSKGVRCIIGLQDNSQLREIYGKNMTESWTSMVGTHFFCKIGGVEARKWVSDMIGTKKVRRYMPSYSSSGTGIINAGANPSTSRTDNWQEVEEPVIRPEEITTTLGRRKDHIVALLFTGEKTVYRLKWPFPKKTNYRKPVMDADWTKAPRPSLPNAADDDAGTKEAGGPAIQPPKPQEQQKPAEKSGKPQPQEKQPVAVKAVEEQAVEDSVQDQDQEQHHEHIEAPGEIVADELAEEAADALVDEALPGAGAIVQAAELAELVQGATADDKHKNEKLVIKHETEAEIWLEDELED